MSTENLSLKEIIDSTADGKLKDRGQGASRFRAFLESMSLDELGKLIQQALTGPADGRALQDVVNILGMKLGFKVEHGLYSGKHGSIGFDGLWQLNEQYLVVECKTTDAYRISTKTLLNYASKIREERQVKHSIPILLVVGRFDTGDIEAQIRGSRIDELFSVIGVDALLEIAKLSEKLYDGPASNSLSQFLLPEDHTRLDNIVWMMKDLISEKSQGHINESQKTSKNTERIDVSGLDNLRNSMIKKLKDSKGGLHKFSNRSKVLYETQTNEKYIFLVSKKYTRDNIDYWYSIRPYWYELMKKYGGGLVLGFEEESDFVCIPIDDLRELIKGTNRDISKSESSWKMEIRKIETKLELQLPKFGKTISLEDYKEKFGERN